jgi:NHL repeat
LSSNRVRLSRRVPACLLVIVTALAGLAVRRAAGAGESGTVAAVAGSGRVGYDGDGGPAVDARLYQPRMMTFDGAGNMYITDTFNQVIRVVDPGGTISTVAGVATPVAAGSGDQCPRHFSGDGGPALEAKLSCPHSVAVSPSGRLAIADSANDRIREVDENGIIRTIVGTGLAGFGGDGGPAAQAKLNDPKGILYDPAGNLYIADTSNDRIRKVGTDGIITTVIGTGVQGGDGDGGPALAAQLSEPRTLGWGPTGELYITEPKIHRIRKVDAGGIITRLAGTSLPGFSGDGGPAADAALDTPRGIAADADGVVYIADSGNHRIRRIGADGIITTIAGTGVNESSGDGGPAAAASFDAPRATAIFGNDLYVADTFGNRIRVIKGITTGPAVSAAGPSTVVTTSSTTTSSTSTSSTSTTTTTRPNPTTTTTTSTTTTTTTSTANPTGETTTTTGAHPASDPSASPASDGGPGAAAPATPGYWMLGTGGEVYPFGDAVDHGGATPLPASVSAVDIEPTPSGKGYWILRSDGDVRAYGDAVARGGVPAGRLAPGERVVSLSATPSAAGYWVFTDRGRAVPFGDAPFLGDMSKLALNGPVLDSVATPSGAGYYMVAGDGGIFSFGDARFFGSMGGQRLNAPVRSLVPTLAGDGYWLVASDGGIFAFSAPFRGSMGAQPLNRPVTGMVRFGDGYLMVASDGGVFDFSSLPFAGSLGGHPPANPVVALAPLPPARSRP